MKFNSRMCVRCGGSKKIPDREFAFGKAKMIKCPNCGGEGIEYIISPKQLKEYKMLKKELKDAEKHIGELEEWANVI